MCMDMLVKDIYLQVMKSLNFSPEVGLGFLTFFLVYGVLLAGLPDAPSRGSE